MKLYVALPKLPLTESPSKCWLYPQMLLFKTPEEAAKNRANQVNRKIYHDLLCFAVQDYNQKNQTKTFSYDTNTQRLTREGHEYDVSDLFLGSRIFSIEINPTDVNQNELDGPYTVKVPQEAAVTLLEAYSPLQFFAAAKPAAAGGGLTLPFDYESEKRSIQEKLNAISNIRSNAVMIAARQFLALLLNNIYSDIDGIKNDTKKFSDLKRSLERFVNQFSDPANPTNPTFRAIDADGAIRNWGQNLLDKISDNLLEEKIEQKILPGPRKAL